MKPSRIYLIIILLAVLPYVNAISGDFVYDDTRLITSNENLKDWSNLWRGFGRDYYASTSDRITLGYYRPVTVGITLVDYHLWGNNPAGYHVTNIAFHAANSLLLYRIASFFLPLPFALAASAIFAVHPVHTETVTFISGRVDAIAAFFYLTALFLFLRWRKPERPLADWRYGLSLMVFFCGLLSKEMAITLPLAILALLLVERVKLRAIITQVAPYFAVIAVYLVIRFAVLGHLAGKVDFSHGTSLLVRAMTAVKIAAYYLYTLLLPPVGLNMEPPIALVQDVADPYFILSCAVIAAAVIGSIVLNRRMPAFSFGLLWFMVSLGPVLNIIPIETLAAERFLYIPSAGFALALSAGLGKLVGSGFKPAPASHSTQVKLNWAHLWPILLLVVACLPITVHRNSFWQDDIVLWTEKLKTVPGLPSAYDHMGSYYLRKGEIEKGIDAFRALVKVAPNHARAHYNIGVYLEKKGLYADAAAEYTRAIQSDPTHAGAHYNLGLIYFREGKVELAYQEWTETLRFAPGHQGALYWMQMRR
ncbi:MAG: tetratricopeptide repeat protein [Nitrospirota bacterium]|nr:tetratricopeptide repeat protein [Nitrospirota bacterium]